jgi:hypothetical protein
MVSEETFGRSVTSGQRSTQEENREDAKIRLIG